MDQKTERKTILITFVGEAHEVTYGDNKKLMKLKFGGEIEGSKLNFECIKEALFPTIQEHKGKQLDVEYSIKSREYDGTTYTDRTVFQAYVGGKAVVEAKAGGGKQWSGSGRSIESIDREWQHRKDISALERISIEGQVALKEMGELIRAELAPDDVKAAYVAALLSKVKAFAGETVNPPALVVKPAPALKEAAKKAEQHQQNKEDVFDNAEQAKKIDALQDGKPISTVGDLLTMALTKHKFSKADVLKILCLKDVKDIKDPGKAWAYIQKYAQNGNSDEAFNAL
ncbi:MAG: hypothetical protein U1D67_04850 [Dehalococcoidia bacterium]|nr:hypothetical protein [Dehalococcoidia bacterium]